MFRKDKVNFKFLRTIRVNLETSRTNVVKFLKLKKKQKWDRNNLMTE